MIRVTVIALLAVILTGCAGRLAFVVPESEKDPTFSFDGVYTATVDHPGGRQEMGSGWYSNCSAQEFWTTFSITSSKVVWSWGERNIEGFVNADGKLRLEELLDEEVKGIGTMMSDGSVTLILQGNVSSGTMKGSLTYGIAQFGKNGCSYPMVFAKN